MSNETIKRSEQSLSKSKKLNFNITVKSESESESDSNSKSRSKSSKSNVSSEQLNLIDKEIEETIDRRMRDDIKLFRKPIIKEKMRKAMKKIYNEIIDNLNILSDSNILTDYINLHKSREKKVKSWKNLEYIYTTNFYKSKEKNNAKLSKYFLKVYEGDEMKKFYSILVKLIAEIYFHKRAENLKSICKFNLPILYSYGIINSDSKNLEKSNDERFKFYLKMKYIDLKSLYTLDQIKNDKFLIKIIKEIKKITDCFEKNYLYHNDLHAENIYLKLNKMANNIEKIYILDYGESVARELQHPDHHLKKIFSYYLKDYDYDVEILNKPKHKSKVRSRLTKKFKKRMSKPKHLLLPKSLTLKKKQASSYRPKTIGGKR